ncbi:MAG: nucleotidyl transferase AbiEii/AbiGii toxin family protein [Gammaproteobacteria bacterium]|nr:nucleotidyl transferase AbiEii/AbiGii toxin family protein [Gammaproteobacteria bacterium]
MLTLSDNCSKTLHLVLELIDEIAPRSSFLLGGGTVLEARWHHRLSTDIDLFTNEKAMFELIDPFIRLASTEKWLSRGIAIEQIFGAYGVMGSTPHGEFSIHGNPNIFSNARTEEEIEGTGIFAQSIPEILLRKIRARMVRTALYYSRDAYDVVVATLYAPNELKLALDNLNTLENDSLEFDRHRTDLQIRDLEDLIKPKFPQIVKNLQSFLFDVLTRRIHREDFLNILDFDQEFPY